MAIKNIDAKTLSKWLEKDDVIIVDVREKAEHEAIKINNSNLIPLVEICKNKLPEISNKKLVLHCHSGKRSLSACQKLLKEDEDLEIYNLEGGINSWKNEGFKIETNNKFFLPLDRQVQLIIGLGVFIGSLLGFFINQIFFLLPIFFGAGLVFASLTGFCGLAMLVAKMPWNKSSKNTISCKI